MYFPNLGSFPTKNIICIQVRRQPREARCHCHRFMEKLLKGLPWKDIKGEDTQRKMST